MGKDAVPGASLRVVGAFFLFTFGCLALVTGYWGIAKSDILLRRSDNPRLVLAEQRVARGSIFAQDGTPLALTTGTPDYYQREYPLGAAASIVGYHSINYGDSGLEKAFAAVLGSGKSGEAWQLWWEHQVLYRPIQGGDVQTTLSAPLQTIAATMLSGHTGAMVVVEPLSGKVLVLASSPSFDPTHIDQEWESLQTNPDKRLLPRATMGLYPPGMALYPVGAALALSYQQELPDETEKSIARLFGKSGERFTSLWEDLGGTASPELSVETAIVPTVDWGGSAARALPETLLLTPLQLSQVAAILANRGARQPLNLISATRAAYESTWVSYPSIGSTLQALSPRVTRQVESYLQKTDRWVGYAATVQTETQQVGWHWGYTPDRKYAWAVALEGESAAEAQRVAEAFLSGLP